MLRSNPISDFGRSAQIEEKLGIDLITGQSIAAIVLFCASIEYHLERALWKLRNYDPAGIRPDTDGRVITDLISMLDNVADAKAGDEQKVLILWCRAARSGFIIRNNIVHGVPAKLESTLTFMRNPTWHGETRKRGYGDFWSDHYSLELVKDCFAVLLRVINALAVGTPVADVGSAEALRALQQVASALGELSDSAGYNPTFEKY